MKTVDLNSDIGESFGAYKLGDDAEILKHITACNVACGYHAGDPMVMDRVVRIAVERGVAVGAHPGYPDLMGFGRRPMKLSHDEAKNYVKYQLGALSAFTTTYGDADPPRLPARLHGQRLPDRSRPLTCDLRGGL